MVIGFKRSSVPCPLHGEEGPGVLPGASPPAGIESVTPGWNSCPYLVELPTRGNGDGEAGKDLSSKRSHWLLRLLLLGGLSLAVVRILDIRAHRLGVWVVVLEKKLSELDINMVHYLHLVTILFQVLLLM